GAVVEHQYSQSTGRATPLKAYFVERNRLYTVLKNFPARLLWRVPWIAVARYFWHAVSLASGQGKAAEFRKDGHSGALLLFLVLRAHAAALWRLPKLLAQHRRIMRSRKLTSTGFSRLLRQHSIGVREVASL